MKQFRGFKVKCLPATNTLGTRVKITCMMRGNSFVIPYDYSMDNIMEMAEKFLNGKGILIGGYASLGASTAILLTNSFEAVQK